MYENIFILTYGVIIDHNTKISYTIHCNTYTGTLGTILLRQPRSAQKNSLENVVVTCFVLVQASIISEHIKL